MFSCSLSRHVWALTYNQSSKGGFHEDSIYANFSLLLSNGRNPVIPIENRKSFPWIVCFSRRIYTKFYLKVSCFLAIEMAEKIKKKKRGFPMVSLDWEKEQIHETCWKK